MSIRRRFWMWRRRKVSAIESLAYGGAYASATTPEARASLSQLRPFVREELLQLDNAPNSLEEGE